MMNKMTWEERRNMHKDLCKEHRTKAIEELKLFRETLNRKHWDEYKAEDRLANKHWGISQAMFTRKYGKI